MRRTFGFIALALGLVLLFLAPLSLWYVTPRVKKIPLDYYYRAVSDGTGLYLNPSQGFKVIGPVRLKDVHTVKGTLEGNTDPKTVAVWDSFDSTFDVDNNHELAYSLDRYTFDRTTALGVDCCGQNQDRTGSLSLLFPIGPKRATYPFWDPTAKRAFPMVYQETTSIDGLTVYRYHQHIQPMQLSTLSVPGSAVGLTDPSVKLNWMYTSQTDVWVEQVTGAILKGSQVSDQYLADPITGARMLTIAAVSFTQTDLTVQGIVDTVKPEVKKLQALQFAIPVFGAVGGVVLILLGLLLLGAFSRRSEPQVAPAPAAVAY